MTRRPLEKRMNTRPARRGRPRKDPEEIRARLLSSAATLFNRDGYFGTDSNKIARAAGIGPASFYRHFADKKAIFLEAYALWVDGDWAILERRSAAPDQDASRRARARAESAESAESVVAAYLRRHRQWSVFRRSMHALVASDEEARRFHLSIRRNQMRRLAAMLDAVGAPERDREELLRRFLSFERCANALADGEVAALGLSEARFEEALTREIEAISPPPSAE